MVNLLVVKVVVASAGVVSGEGSIDEIILDGYRRDGTDAGDQITQEIGTEDYVLGKDGYINDDGFEWVNDNNTSTRDDEYIRHINKQ